MEKIVFLGPYGSTFSWEAYYKASLKYDYLPKFNDENVVLLPVKSNKDVLPVIFSNSDSYGILAVETKAQGRIDESVEQLMKLLNEKTIYILCAIKIKISFCLMVRPGVNKNEIKGILAHEKAFGACEKNTKLISANLVEVGSNGLATEMVANNKKYAKYAAIGPRFAAEKMGLEILESNFEDEEAWTTFFIFGPSNLKRDIAQNNRALVIFISKNERGSLVKALNPLENVNLIHLHSANISGSEYAFLAEIEIPKEEILLFQESISGLEKQVARSIVFGPFCIEEI